MKKILFGLIAGMLVATAVGAYEAEEHKGSSPMGGMMQGMKEMMARMSKMMDMCSQMMGSHGNRLDQQPSEKK